MRFLVAGCGWLGREVALRLEKRGDRVTAIVRTEDSASRLRSEDLEAYALDLADPGGWDFLPIVDGVVAAHSASGRNVAAYRHAYLDATRNLLSLKAATRARFVYVSSTGVFGQTDGSWVDETTPPSPYDPTAEVLVEAERLVLDDSRHGATRCVIRCSGLYGPGRTGVIERVRSGALALGDGDESFMNFAHRDDAAATVVAALDRGRPGAIYHASDAAPATRRDVVTFIAERLGIAPARRHGAEPSGAGRDANRRVRAEATRRELGIDLAYPSYREGLAPFLT
jgi:nucleoside-diphosphate-sugar epimerase